MQIIQKIMAQGEVVSYEINKDCIGNHLTIENCAESITITFKYIPQIIKELQQLVDEVK